jgi:hypothetical protein
MRASSSPQAGCLMFSVLATPGVRYLSAFIVSNSVKVSKLKVQTGFRNNKVSGVGCQVSETKE